MLEGEQENHEFKKIFKDNTFFGASVDCLRLHTQAAGAAETRLAQLFEREFLQKSKMIFTHETYEENESPEVF